MKRIYFLLLCGLMMFMAACEKDTMPVQFAPSVTTGNATDIYRKGAVLSGSIQMSGTAIAKNYGILFSELESMAEYAEYPVTNGSKDFSINMSNLTPGTKYYYCAYAHSGYSLVKGAVKSFSTKESNAPIFSSINLLSKNEISCTVSASFLDEGGSEILLSGFCWSKASEGEPTADSHGQIVTITNGVMSAEITGLEPETDYLVRAYASNSTGVGYSESVRITTDAARTPVLSAITQTESSNFSVNIEAQLINEGTSAVTAVGFCWSTEKQEPTIEDSNIDLTEQLKGNKTTFKHSLSELDPNTTYYIRAYAINAFGTTYSAILTFKTPYKDADNGDIGINNLPTTEWK